MHVDISSYAQKFKQYTLIFLKYSAMIMLQNKAFIVIKINVYFRIRKKYNLINFEQEKKINASCEKSTLSIYKYNFKLLKLFFIFVSCEKV